MHVYIRAMRLPFLTGSLIPALLAAALAFHHGFFRIRELLLVLVGVGSLHLAANLINDYYDAEGSDRLNLQPTPFSGGSRVIPDDLLSPGKVLFMALFFFLLGSFCGLLLILLGRPFVAVIGLLGLLAGLFYSAGPFRFMSRGLGELTIFLAFGPLITWGTYYVLSNRLTGQAFLLGFPLGFLITAVIWINQFPDFPADRAARKNNLVVRLGLARAKSIYPLLMLSPFPFLFYLWGGQDLSVFILGAWLALPVVWKGIRLFQAGFASHERIIPAQALTIQSHLLLGVLMLAGILAGHFFE